MAWQFSQSSTLPGIVATLPAGDDLFVASGVTIASLNSLAVSATGGNHDIIVYGTVANASGSTIQISGDQSNDFGNTVTIKAGAQVQNMGGNAAIAIIGYGSSIVNAGLISSHGFGIALYGVKDGAITTIANTGTIEAGGFAIIRDASFSSETFVVNNSGLITGGLASFGFSAFSAPGLDVVTNTGRMIGDILLDAGADVYNGVAGRLSGHIFGRGGADTISTGVDNDWIDGGTGADTMRGGKGNDFYVVDTTADKVIELANEGIDTVESSLSHTLAANVEKLVLSAAAGTTGVGNVLANTITGNTGNNVLYGLAGNDVLSGGIGSDRLFGGAGVDTLTGGANADIFAFNTAPNAATNRDIVTDFSHVDDTFQLENAIFIKLGAGVHALNPAFFRAGAVAADANDYIVYNQANGVLSYDVNGNGAGGAIQIAALINKPVLTASDFAVI
jgi:Ca2+-binding RTX toxin-like protein